MRIGILYFSLPFNLFITFIQLIQVNFDQIDLKFLVKYEIKA